MIKYMSSPQFKLRYLLNFQRQRKKISEIGNYGRLDFEDIKRLDKYIKGNIFVSNECCLYTGEVKKKYSTISYQGKKVSVLRLLYHNYIDDVEEKDTLEYLCDNPGVCCNLKHFKIKGKDHDTNFEDCYDDFDDDPFKKTKKKTVLQNLNSPNITLTESTEDNIGEDDLPFKLE